MDADKKPTLFVDHKQAQQPGIERQMDFKPEFIRPDYKGSGKLEGKVALITGGDSGIGRSVAIHFAREGADIAISYLTQEQDDAEDAQKLIEKEGRKCLLLPGNLKDKAYCVEIVEKTVAHYGKLNIVVNNAAIQYVFDDFLDVTDEQIEETFDVNIFSYFRVTRAALKHLKEGDSIINTSSINAYRGLACLVDYSATKGAVTAFTRALALQLATKKIRVNAIAPGPIWTPLVVSTYKGDNLENFGTATPLGRAGQPSECGPCYVFLASQDASYITGQCIHPNGGYTLNT